MKSKIFTLTFMLIAILSINIKAQPLNWQENSPSDWEPITITSDFENKTEGETSLKITFTETGTPYFVSDTFDVTASTAFTFTMDVLDNDPAAEVNLRVRFIDASGTGTNFTSADYSADNASFQTLTYSETAPADAVKAYVIVRMYDVAANWTTSGTFNLDNASFTQGGSNLLENPGFEDWAVPVEGSTTDNWQEDSPSDWEPITIAADATNKTHGLFSANITFTETGTPYFISDTFNVTASTAFNFSIDVLDNDPAAEVNLRVRFIDASGTGTNFTSADYSVDNASFQTLTYSETAPADAVKAYVIVRMYDVAANWTSSGTFNLDNASFTQGGDNLLANPSFENWTAPPAGPIFLTYSFAGLNPAVDGIINTDNFTVDLTVPFATDLTNLVATFTTENTTDVKVGTTSQVSGTTANDFTSAVTYSLEGTESNQDWTVTVSKDAASTEKDILSFVFAGLDPEVFGTIDKTNHTIDLAVPTGTNLTALVPTITLSEFATISPESGVAQDFTNSVTYTVTAQDESTKAYTVTVTETDEVVIFQEYFESVPYLIPDGWTLLENDNYIPNAGDERWTDSAWVVSTSGRPEWAGNHMAIALSYYSDMPAETGKTNDWLITPAITLGANSTLSWKAMSLTSSGNYPDDYKVIVAPASESVEPTELYFEQYGRVVMTVAPENWSAAVSNPGDGIAERSIALKDVGEGYADMDVWIAFVCITGDGGGSYLAVDDIKVFEGATTGIFNPVTQELKVSVYPNPTNGEFKIVVNTDVSATAEIEIIDLVGRVVFNSKEQLHNGQNHININATTFDKGIYLVNTQINNKSKTTKLIIE